MPGFKVVGFFGVLAPASTPRDILARLNGEIVKVVAKPEIRKSFEVQALEPANTSPISSPHSSKARSGGGGS